MMVQNQAGKVLQLSIQKLGCRCECRDQMPLNLQQEAKQLSHGIVIIDYGYLTPIGLGHVCSPGAGNNQIGPSSTLQRR